MCLGTQVGIYAEYPPKRLRSWRLAVAYDHANRRPFSLSPPLLPKGIADDSGALFPSQLLSWRTSSSIMSSIILRMSEDVSSSCRYRSHSNRRESSLLKKRQWHSDTLRDQQLNAWLQMRTNLPLMDMIIVSSCIAVPSDVIPWCLFSCLPCRRLNTWSNAHLGLRYAFTCLWR